MNLCESLEQQHAVSKDFKKYQNSMDQTIEAGKDKIYCKMKINVTNFKGKS